MTRRSQAQYPPELRERAVRMVAEIQGDYDSPWPAMRAGRHDAYIASLVRALSTTCATR